MEPAQDSGLGESVWVWLAAGEEPGRATLFGGAIVLAALALNELTGLRGEARRPATP